MTPPLEDWEGRAVEAWRIAWSVPELRIHDEVSSTNDVARALAAAGAAAFTVIIADAQSAGRGQHGRIWTAAPRSSVLMSVVLPTSAADTSTAPLRVGIAVARALEHAAGVPARIKWPNDILIDGRKVAGILCEGVIAGERSFVVAGIGVNVTQAAADLPVPAATSLRLAGAQSLERGLLCGAILHELRATCAQLGRPLEQELLDEFDRRDALRGRTVEVDGRVGVMDGVTADGALRLCAQGTVQELRNGTVRLHAGTAINASGVAR